MNTKANIKKNTPDFLSAIIAILFLSTNDALINVRSVFEI